MKFKVLFLLFFGITISSYSQGGKNESGKIESISAPKKSKPIKKPISKPNTNSKELVSCLFNTLEMGGYIANRQTVERQQKLNDLVNE